VRRSSEFRWDGVQSEPFETLTLRALEKSNIAMNRTLRVLHVEDSDQDVALLTRYLSGAGYEPISDRVETLETMKAALESHEWDLILGDSVMPHFTALDALALVQELELDIPFIIISATVGEAMAVEAMRAGAQDYLMKHNLTRLGATIERELRDHESRRRCREAEAELRKSQAQYRRLLDTTNEGVWVVDAQLTTTYVNRRMAEMLQMRPTEMIGRPALDFLDAEDRLDMEQRWHRRTQGIKEQYDLHLRRADGADLWAIVCATPILDGHGQFVGALSMVTDITERKRAEEKLRESEERYREVVENAHDVIYSHDLLGHFTSINKVGEQITGYTREEALALNLDQIVAPEYLENTREMLTRQLAGEDVAAYELEVIAKDGRRITLEVNPKLSYQDGQIVGLQGIARDVTERRQLEDQLRQSQKMEAIGQLAAGVAHDFNNLLTAINGYNTLALRRLDQDHPIRSYLDEIGKAGDRAVILTRQLLAFGRKQILKPLALNLNDIVFDVNKMLQRLIGESVQLTTKLGAGLKCVKADPGQIEQVIINLVVNARDAMPSGGNIIIETGNVELDENYARTHVHVQPGHYVMLAVSDTGVGMEEETLSRIFEPFFTTKEKEKGTGLGLSTVYGIVKQSDGNICVYSEPAHGTTFKVYLPQLETVTQVIGTVTEATSPRGTETVLLVEDDEAVRRLASQILEDAGYNVIATAQGADAVRLCSNGEHSIDLLLTDVVMRETSGKEVADLISELVPGSKVLFMSGYTDEAIVHHGVLDLDAAFIQKPFTPAALAKKIRAVLDSGRQNHGGAVNKNGNEFET